MSEKPKYDCLDCGAPIEQEGWPIPGTDGVLGYYRYCEDCRQSPMEGEEYWYAPQDPGHKRSMKWGGK